MRRFKPSTRSIAGAVAVSAVVAGLAVPAAGARTAFNGNACTLLSAAQLTPIHVGSKCRHKSIPAEFGGINAGTIYWANWGTPFNGSVLVNVYDVQPAYVGPAKAKFDTDGTSVGVGDWSRFHGFANGKTAARITFGVGNYIVDIAVDTQAKHPLKSKSQVVNLAKHIAGLL